MTSEFKITCVADAIELIKPEREHLRGLVTDHNKDPNLFPHGIWFRGHQDSGWLLEPHVFRLHRERPTNRNIEGNMFWDFRLSQASEGQRVRSQFDWLCLMQHYRLPTRLLDWTESVLVALYFAVDDDDKTREKDGALFALSAFKLNAAVEGVGYSILLPGGCPVFMRAEMVLNESLCDLLDEMRDECPTHSKKTGEYFKEKESNREAFKNRLSFPVAVSPNKIDSRMIVQASVFVLHGGIHVANHDIQDVIPEPTLLETLNKRQTPNDQFFTSFRIPCKHKAAIKDELRRLGVHQGTLFPDLEHHVNFRPYRAILFSPNGAGAFSL